MFEKDGEIMPQYSASIITHSFWFTEFSQYLTLLEQGLSQQDIREMALEENYFQQQSTARAKDMERTLERRVNVLDHDYLELFPALDLDNQKLINLLSVLKLNRLFDEFVYEVYRNELLLGDERLHGYEIETFFSQKQSVNNQVAGWKEQTIRRLTGTFKTFLREANLLSAQEEYDLVKRPLLDIRFEMLLRSKGDLRQLASFLGR